MGCFVIHHIIFETEKLWSFAYFSLIYLHNGLYGFKTRTLNNGEFCTIKKLVQFAKSVRNNILNLSDVCMITPLLLTMQVLVNFCPVLYWVLNLEIENFHYIFIWYFGKINDEYQIWTIKHFPILCFVVKRFHKNWHCALLQGRRMLVHLQWPWQIIHTLFLCKNLPWFVLWLIK